MKPLYAFLFFCACVSTLSAQKNVVKGRAFALPGSEGPVLFSLGIGLERMVGHDFSVQVLYNQMGYNMHGTDGGAATVSGLVPELRYYFGKKKAISLNKAAFCSLFTEINFLNYERSGEGSEETSYTFTDKSTSINPGILIGKNLRISKRWYMECYLGGKARFVNAQEIVVENGTATSHATRYVKAGMRAGVNVGVRF
ncbi:MAG: DUF3575 domain-containing protein [Saprospiraceae bacterium]|nr:DUF3575 domain-containing protein [Saprospiraceae bacterium]